MFHSAGPILLTLLPFVISSPLPLPIPTAAQDASSLDLFIPFEPLASRTTHDATHSLWVPRSKLDQMERRIIRSHRFDDTDADGVGTIASRRSTSLGGSLISSPHRRRSRDRISSRDRDHVFVQRQDQTLGTLGDFVDLGSAELAGAKVLFATHITQAGASAQETGVVAGSGAKGTMMIEVIPSTNELQTSAGTITESCLTMLSDPTQRFCETILNGQRIGSDAGIPQAPPASSAGVAASSTASAEVGPTQSGDPLAAAAVTESVSSEAAVTSSEAASSIGAVVNAADPTVNASSSDASASASASASSTEFSLTANAQITNSPIVVNDSAQATDPSGSGSSAEATGSIVVVNDPAPPSSAGAPLSLPSVPSAIMLNGPTSSAAVSGSGSESLITAPSSTASIFVVNAPPATSSNATAAAQENNAAEQTIPGQKMQVLPIGLGIFGGLAGITLLVVGYVYWERRKYKQQFRKRKAAEKRLMDRAAPMGSGGYGSA